MKIVVDEMPKEPMECLFYGVKYNECRLDDGLSCKFSGGECPHLAAMDKPDAILLEIPYPKNGKLPSCVLGKIRGRSSDMLSL